MKNAFGESLYSAAWWKVPRCEAALWDFRGTGVLEIVQDHAGDTYRVVYRVRIAGRRVGASPDSGRLKISVRI
ncbi:MAG TPA: hypothetical protein VEI01_02820 [Terriglobales bacterium]|nr:hypothetical protein [Terriglobales bacterium]